MDSKFTDSGKVLILKSDWKKLGLNNVATSAPSNPEEGEPWYESDLNAFGVYNGSTWMSNFKITDIVDATGLELLRFSATGSAVNELTITNATTGNAPSLSATGGDENINLNLAGKGTGKVVIPWMPSGTKMLFKQATAPTGWTVDDTIQDNSMVVYRRSASYAASGGSQDPTSLTTPAQTLNTYGSAYTLKAWGSEYVGYIAGENALYLIDGSGSVTMYQVAKTVNAVTLQPYFTHVICATKN